VVWRHDHAVPHSLDVDGHTAVAGMRINEAIYAARPAGAAWSSVNDLLRYVEMELADGVLPDGTRYVSEQTYSNGAAPRSLSEAPEATVWGSWSTIPGECQWCTMAGTSPAFIPT
jgi:hypothetical protein